MRTDAVSIINKAEYIANFKNGKNVHKVNGILAKVYFLCSFDKLGEAQALVEELYRLVNQRLDYSHQPSILPVDNRIKNKETRKSSLSRIK